MKIKGKKISGANEEIIIIPRGNGEDIVFVARAIMNYKPFEALVAEPTPPSKLMRGGQKVLDTDNRSYKAALENYNKKRGAWSIITALSATPDLEWETVDYDIPDTWINWESELRDSGFSESEIVMVLQGVSTANSLNEEKLEAARDRFLRSRAAQLEVSSSPTEEIQTTQSGEPVNESESGLQT